MWAVSLQRERNALFCKPTLYALPFVCTLQKYNDPRPITRVPQALYKTKNDNIPNIFDTSCQRPIKHFNCAQHSFGIAKSLM
jgi:hypothetical protein